MSRRELSGKPLGGVARRLQRAWPAVAYAALLAIAAASAYVRLIPYLRYGRTLSEVDPYEYLWLANYLYSHGLGGLEGLRHVAFWWYPWGRDFLSTEYLGLPLLAALAARLAGGASLTEEALSLSPVAFAVVGVLGSFLAVRAIRGGYLGPLAAALGFAFLPILVLDHGFATDPAKVFDGIALLPYPMYFLARSYRSGDPWRSIAWAAAGGASGGLIAWLWGGYEYMALLVSVVAAVEPFLQRPTPRGAARLGAAWLAFAAVSLTSPAVRLSTFYRGLGLAPLALVAAYALEAFYGGLRLDRLGLSRSPGVRLHAWLLMALAGLAASLIAGGLLSLPSRVLLGLGVAPPPTSVVPLTVQEYMGTSLRSVAASTAPYLLATAVGAVALAALYATGAERPSPGDVLLITSMALSAVFIYASVREAYYMPSAALYTVIAGGASISLLASVRSRTYDKRRRAHLEGPNLAAQAGAALLAVIVVASSAYYAGVEVRTLALEAPSIETAWLGPMAVPTASGSTKVIVPVNDAWKLALSYVREETPPDSVIVSWWDYGYWIGVLANRTTVVDGSTVNGTQIALVANALTAPVGQSGAYLEMMGLPANRTYVLVYEFFVGIYDNSTRSVLMFPYPNIYPLGPGAYAITYGQADMAKSYQMLRISLRVDPYYGNPLLSNYSSVTAHGGYEFYQFPGLAGSPQANVSRVLGTTIYDLMLYGVSRLKAYGVMGEGAAWLASAANFTPAAVQYVDPTTGSVAPVPLSPPDPGPYYEPVAFFASVPYAWTPAGSNVTYFYAVVVFLYRWTGLP